MALETTFRTLSVQLRRLCDMLNAVLLTVGDKPQNRETALADGLESKLLDLLGGLGAARSAAKAARNAVGAAKDLDHARRALAKCQDAFHKVEQKFMNELISYESLRSLTSLGGERGGEWKHWAASMKDAIEQARQPFEETSKALVACWQELAERLGTMNISVRANGLVQNLSGEDKTAPKRQSYAGTL
jgi:ElaB/YqjD/DUF883 family membrane-anchored ribosome-binding protein